MSNIKVWISALRPRTLFLAVATTLCGSGIAYSEGFFNMKVCILTILTATFLQLLSNLANDLGDFQHGTDTTGERIGPTRTVQSGAITPKQMIRAIWITIILTGITGILLLEVVSNIIGLWYLILFLALGTASIIAAIKYTAGKNPYGYKGLGDIFSFFFFGPVSVVGTYFLHTAQLTFQPWLPAIAMGLFTAAVLNINNMRDMDNDKKSGKITLAGRLGKNGAKLYHTILTFVAIACFIAYSVLYSNGYIQYLYMLFFIPYLLILVRIFKIEDKKQLDPYLKYTSMATFFLAVAFIVCINLN